ncbi:MAG: DUF3842 family protein [Lentihominibacter sp.]
MNILVIDAQGGGIGKQLVAEIKNEFPDVTITAVGTNSIATSAMLRAGANYGATGENAVAVACRTADVIIGPIGIIIADAMIGEITPAMTTSITQADAVRILIPFNNCNTFVAGITDQNTRELISASIETLRTCIES